MSLPTYLAPAGSTSLRSLHEGLPVKQKCILLDVESRSSSTASAVLLLVLSRQLQVSLELLILFFATRQVPQLVLPAIDTAKPQC